MLAVPAVADEREEVRDILEEYGATDISSITLGEESEKEVHHPNHGRYTHH